VYLVLSAVVSRHTAYYSIIQLSIFIMVFAQLIYIISKDQELTQWRTITVNPRLAKMCLTSGHAAGIVPQETESCSVPTTHINNISTFYGRVALPWEKNQRLPEVERLPHRGELALILGPPWVTNVSFSLFCLSREGLPHSWPWDNTVATYNFAFSHWSCLQTAVCVSVFISGGTACSQNETYT
jgi:hypothetical protein